MNERIKELWNKAAKSTAAYPSGQNNSWETQVNFMNKFAELIVRECASLVQGVPTDTMGYHTADQKIKEHFGVEE